MHPSSQVQVLQVQHDEEEGELEDEPGMLMDEPAEADMGLEPAIVLARIEELVAEYLAGLAAGLPPQLEFVSRSRANAVLHADDLTVAVGALTQRRCLLAGQGVGALSYVRGEPLGNLRSSLHGCQRQCIACPVFLKQAAPCHPVTIARSYQGAAGFT
jgi:hypothetical protein